MIESWKTSTAAGMDDALLVDQVETVRRHPWWHARARLVETLLRALQADTLGTILDAGCGWGVTLEHLERRGFQVAGLDTSLAMLRRLDRPARRLIFADLMRGAPTGETFDTVLALDVIEHIDDDVQAIGRLAALISPGGRLIVSVPALPELFSEFDQVQGHRRRYLADGLQKVLMRNNLIVERLFYWGAWLVPLLKRQRSKARSRAGDSAAEAYSRYLELPPACVLPLLRLAFAIDTRQALLGRLRTGTSVFAVAAKPQGLVVSASESPKIASKSACAIRECPAALGWHQSR
jgi:SAM-dependent methyltransferase